jgi:hypothetical protein
MSFSKRSPSIRFILLVLILALWLLESDAFVQLRLPQVESSESLLHADVATGEGPKKRRKLSRPERKALERKNKQEKQANQKRKQKSKYNLNSKAVSKLTQESTADDVLKAIKRAQNLHDHNDLRVIADFLIKECDTGFAYGYRGSLLARLAVAALHFGNDEVARRSIDIRRLEYRSSMLPMESAAIIRGLLRMQNATDAIEVLNDELSLPLEVSDHNIFIFLNHLQP